MFSINVGVFGLLSLWRVNLDPISMCTTLMSIGFSVDFTGRSFSRSIGWPMIQAGCSTILCISPLLLVDSYMVYVFVKTVYLVIVLGLLHGIVFLPALLLTLRMLCCATTLCFRHHAHRMVPERRDNSLQDHSVVSTYWSSNLRMLYLQVYFCRFCVCT
ncbi:unnamed protein product [Angiostrongylus costaricensis]|uniref:Monocarboxylate transporter n=1 Tax=Angiostrongylus costaricensis TaxID=334426 RepID=A0A0R3Q2S1_ANGCS|nr:unnamed protein product [Angiostrongylus costaricensis]